VFSVYSLTHFTVLPVHTDQGRKAELIVGMLSLGDEGRELGRDETLNVKVHGAEVQLTFAAPPLTLFFFAAEAYFPVRLQSQRVAFVYLSLFTGEA